MSVETQHDPDMDSINRKECTQPFSERWSTGLYAAISPTASGTKQLSRLKYTRQNSACDATKPSRFVCDA